MMESIKYQSIDKCECQSPIKWAGGKSKLVDTLIKYLPDGLNTLMYIEPFVGGGSVFISLISKKILSPKTKIILNDINTSLITFYKSIKLNVEILITSISRLIDEFNTSDDFEQFYYSIRTKYNTFLKEKRFNDELSAIFLFLNMTCFNGLYRVNSSGEFNVPIGRSGQTKKGNQTIYSFDEERINNLRNLSYILNNFYITFENLDYKEIIDKYDSSDSFFYIDPPYFPYNKTSFVKYSSDFNFTDFFECINRKFTSKILISNSDTEQVKNNVFSYYIAQIETNHSIGRKCANEIILKNYLNNDEEEYRRTNGFKFY
jgi:DNA adenine methylase